MRDSIHLQESIGQRQDMTCRMIELEPTDRDSADSLEINQRETAAGEVVPDQEEV